MTRPRLTARVRRGLDHIRQLAVGDIQAAEPGDFSPKQRADLNAGLVYLDGILAGSWSA